MKDEQPAVLTDREREELEAALLLSVLGQIEPEWNPLPETIAPMLEAAAHSGVKQGLSDLVVHDADIAEEARAAASEYAQARAAELVGMSRDSEGNLIANEDAEMAISETTRERIREIISNAFDESMTLGEVQENIADALRAESETGIFSEARAKMIAQTEIKRAQVFGHMSAWLKSGVTKVSWFTTSAEPCPECIERDGKPSTLQI